MVDTTPPTIAITSSKTKVKAGETALITFTLSEPATDFVVSDIAFTGGGTLTGFSGSGSNYSAVFTPALTGEGSSVVSVGNFKFSDAAGNANQDGADANNRLELTYDTVRPTITITSNKTNLGLGENATVTFTLSEPSIDFTIDDIPTTYGTLTGFSGSGKTYTATFVPSGVDVGLITVKGYRFSDSFGNQNDQGTRLVITPFDPSRGNVQWTRQLGTSSDDYAYALTTGTDGAIYVAGVTGGSLDGQTSSGSVDAFLTKYNPDGSKAWTRLLGTSSGDATALTTGSDGAIYMAGYTLGRLGYSSLDGQTYSGFNDAFLTKYSADGSKAWSRLLGTSSDDYAYALTTGSDGAIYMAGYTRDIGYSSLDGQTFSGGLYDAFLTKYDANGTKAWTRLLGTSSDDYAYALTTGTDGAIYMAGFTRGSLDGQTLNGVSDTFLTKYNADGSKAWSRLLGSSSGDSASALTTGTDGAIYMAGYTSGSLDGQTFSGGSDAFLTKFVLPDSAIPTIALQADKTSVTAGGSVAITFTLSKPSTNFIASDVTVVNGVLSNFSGSGTTYTATFTTSVGSNTASLSVGSGKFSDALSNFNEDGAETNNTVTISISGSTPSTPLIQFSNTSSSANEGNSGTSTITVQAVLSAASTQTVTIPISYSGTATQGTDYTNATSSISIPAGQTTGTATVSILGDTNVEPNETMILTMGTPTNATLGTNKAYTHTVLNDDLDQQVVSRTNALTVLVDKGVLESNPVLLNDLVEEETKTGTTVTSHTVSYKGTKFKYSDIDALITTVIRNGEFTEEFRKEIADQYPTVGNITYKDAVSLVGAANIDSILISVAGADGNYVG